jgi:2-polyprenyl-6-methoxyphenol hydroxylase-like FAD-dependent oxidoreductase
MSTANAPKALISGASIAGPTLAYCLCRQGYDVTIVERAPKVRGGGYAIDIRGAAIDVVDRLGIGERLRSKHLDTARITFYGGDGREVASVRPQPRRDSGVRLDYELPRGDLTTELWAVTRDDVEYRFNDSIASIDDDGHGVDVVLRSGLERRVDLVFGADGLHSNVRNLVFGTESRFERYIGWCFAIVTLPNYGGMSEEVRVFNTPGRMAALYAAGESPAEIHGLLCFKTDKPPDGVLRDEQEMRELAVAAFGGVTTWEIPRLLDAIRVADDVYCDSVSQIRMPSWSKGRTALVGDAAHATSFLSGQGTSVSLVTPYVLGHELGLHRDHRHAFSAYEERCRDFAERNQAIADRNFGMCVETARDLWLRNAVIRFVAPALTKLRLAHRMGRKNREAYTAIDLAGYAVPSA